MVANTVHWRNPALCARVLYRSNFEQQDGQRVAGKRHPGAISTGYLLGDCEEAQPSAQWRAIYQQQVQRLAWCVLF